MINLSTPNEELINELNSDYRKLGYWMEKKVGGYRKKQELQERLVNKYILTGKIQTSEPLEYISANGNKWYGYYKTFNIGGIPFANSIGFCYYETYGSIGAFVPVNSKSIEGCDGVIIFPSHFFLRLSQRLGVGVRSREVIKRFLEMLDNMVIEYKGDGEKRKDEVEVSFSDSVWRGYWKNGDSRVVELNTFLKHTELSRKQERDAKELQNCQNNYTPRSKETDLHRLMCGDAESWVKELLDNVDGKRIFDYATSAYFNYFNTTHFTTEEVGMDLTAKDFDGLLRAESRGENNLGMIRFIYEHAYELIPEDRFFDTLQAAVFVVLRKLGYNGTIDDIHPCFVEAVKKFTKWREEGRKLFKEHFKK